MKIFLSPAKKMREETEDLEPASVPAFLEQAEEIARWLKARTREELQSLWKCNETILEQNLARLQHMDLRKRLVPAVLSYEGLAFQYMAPAVMETEQLAYLQEHLRILSGFYGVLKPMDGIRPYRLEMQAKAEVHNTHNLYEYWGDRLYREVRDDSGLMINLASKEYSRCIEKYLTKADRLITVVFCEKSGEKLVTKGTYAKMARGEMVRYMAEQQIEDPEKLKEFDRLGYCYREEWSSEKEFVFERN